jgi:hypothetical protein
MVKHLWNVASDGWTESGADGFLHGGLSVRQPEYVHHQTEEMSFMFVEEI